MLNLRITVPAGASVRVLSNDKRRAASAPRAAAPAPAPAAPEN